MHVLLQADQRPKQNHKDVLLPTHPQELLLVGERIWTWCWARRLFAQSITQCRRNWVNLLRHGSLLREDDGAIVFWRLKDYLRNDLERSQYWSDEKWKSRVAKGGGNKKRFQYCTDPSGQEILYLRALQGHSGRKLIDPSLQDNVLIPDDFFEYIYHIGCAILSHTIIKSGLILGGQNLSKKETVFFLLVNHMDKEHKDPETVVLKAPRLAWYKQKVWKNHQNTVYWVDIIFAQKKRLKFYQTRSNAIILYNTLPAYRISKAIKTEIGEVIYEKVYESLRPLPKISLRNNWMKELGSEVIMIDRGDPLFALEQEHPVLRRSKHVLLVKKLWSMIERWNPLFAVIKITSNQLLFALSKRLTHVSLVNVRT